MQLQYTVLQILSMKSIIYLTQHLINFTTVSQKCTLPTDIYYTEVQVSPLHRLNGSDCTISRVSLKCDCLVTDTSGGTTLCSRHTPPCVQLLDHDSSNAEEMETGSVSQDALTWPDECEREQDQTHT